MAVEVKTTSTTDGEELIIEVEGTWVITNMHQRGDNTYIVVEKAS
jgi:hypothetical protein